MTKQEIFDRVATALIKQGKPSISKSGSCSYYDNGDRCAIGWLVTGEQARHLEDNYPGSGCTSIKIDGKSATDYFGVDVNFLEKIQDAHDERSTSKSWFQDWLSRIEDIADEYGLDKSVLNNVK